MSSLLAFLYRLRALAVLLLLQGACLFLIVSGSAYHRVSYLNTSGRAVAETYAAQQRVQGYFALADVNEGLAAENARLRAELEGLKERADIARLDSLARDSTARRYQFVVAKVINNSVTRVNNYLTINKGLAEGVLPGMGVVGPGGVVGRVRNCSDHFSTVTSLLHSRMVISAEIAGSRAFGTVKWRGQNPRDAQLLYIARHLRPKVGDTVLTSSLSTVFPQGLPVGQITRVSIKDDDTFYSIDLALSAEFAALEYVYVVANTLKAEQDSLEATLDRDR